MIIQRLFSSRAQKLRLDKYYRALVKKEKDPRFLSKGPRTIESIRNDGREININKINPFRSDKEIGVELKSKVNNSINDKGSDMEFVPNRSSLGLWIESPRKRTKLTDKIDKIHYDHGALKIDHNKKIMKENK